MMTPERRAAVARGVLLGTFAGDAVAARWEGAGAVVLSEAHQRLAQSLQADVLTYTDDTQLTLALAAHLCDHPHVDQGALVATFLEHFEAHRGYARGMFGVIDAWERGEDPAIAARSVFADGSFGNGAAMRAAPAGVVWDDPAEVARVARAQAEITHAHPIGMDAAAVQARAVVVAAAAGAFGVDEVVALGDACATPQLRTALRGAADPQLRRRPLPDVAAAIGTGVLADQSVPAALWVAAVAADITECVVLSLGLGGDADTIAAMACAVRGAADGGASLPPEWIERFEDGPRGRRYAVALAQRLAAVAADVSSAS